MELAADITPDSLRDVLAELGERVAPTALARERILPVQPALRSLFPDGGLVRGRVMASTGAGAVTLAHSLVRDALLGGAWMAVVDVVGLGVDAANEAGVPLERIVRVDTSLAGAGASAVGSATDADGAGRGHRWLEVMGAVVDGFDVVLASVPPVWDAARPPAGLRALLARIQQRGTVVVVLGRPGPLPVDATVVASGPWQGLGHGHGVLRGRRLRVEASGRRQPGVRRCEIELRVDGDRLRLEQALATDQVSRPTLVAVDDLEATESFDPPSQVVAEMAAAFGDTPIDPADERAVG